MEPLTNARTPFINRLFFSNIKLIVNLVWFLGCVGIAYLALKTIPHTPGILKFLDIDLENAVDHPLEIGLFSTMVGSIAFYMMTRLWVPYLQRWCSQQLLPVNPIISANHIAQFMAYHEALVNRVRALLPEEIGLVWTPDAQQNKNRYMMPLRAEELGSVGMKNWRKSRINNLLLFFDLEFFLNDKDRLQPITIQGDPGSGKSTLIFELYRQNANRVRQQKQGWIPVLVFAHELSWEMLEHQTSVKGLLIDYLNACAEQHREEGYRELARLIRSTYDYLQFIVIIDGLDEVTNRPFYLRMTKKLNELLEGEWKHTARGYAAAASHRYIISCRTDDNQRIITSRLVSLLPIRYEAVLRHLKRLHSYHRQDPDKEQQFRNVITGLETSKTHRLLQNYTSNPYLLSLICEYYRDETRTAQTLNQIFEQVLERELRKARGVFEERRDQESRVKLLPYLSSLMAPYCYRRVMDTLEGAEVRKADFTSYISADETLARILFGDSHQIGYLMGVYGGRTRVREERFQELASIWGEEKTKQFRNFLDSERESSASYPVFLNRATDYLHKDVLNLLEAYSLVEVDEETGLIKRFRHRRMQDYFMALYVDRAGLVAAAIPLKNAWMREPIRLIAAVSSRPEQLINAFVAQYEDQEGSGHSEESGHLSRVSDLMLNASDAVAYLPKPRRRDTTSQLYKAVHHLGTQALRLYFLVWSGERDSMTSARVGWLGLMAKCLTAVRNIYASEFLRNDKAVCEIRITRSGAKPANVWKRIYGGLQQESNSLQHIAYQQLYPIRRAQMRFPLKAHSLFYLVMDRVLIFPSAYDRLIKDTHSTRLSRMPIWVAGKLESVVSVLVAAILLMYIWNPSDTSQPVEFKILFVSIATLFALILARYVQALRYMNWLAAHHLPAWLALKAWKWIWSSGKLILAFLVQLVSYILSNIGHAFVLLIMKAPAYIARLLQHCGRAIIRALRFMVSHPVPFISSAIFCLLVLVSRAYAVPFIAHQIRAFEYRHRTDAFLNTKGEVDKGISELQMQVKELRDDKPSKEDISRQVEVSNAIGEEKARIFKLTGEGRYLLDTSEEFSPSRRGEIEQYTHELVRDSDALTEIKTEAESQGQRMRHDLELESYRRRVDELRREISRLTSNSQLVSAPSEEASKKLDEVNQHAGEVDELVEEGEHLQSDPTLREEILLRHRQLIEGKQHLRQVASNLQSQVAAVSSPAPATEMNTSSSPEPATSNVITDENVSWRDKALKSLNNTILKDDKEALEFVKEFVSTRGERLAEVEREARAPVGRWDQIGVLRRNRIDGQIRFLNQTASADSKVSQLRKQLESYKADLAEIKDHSNDSGRDTDLLPVLERRFSEVSEALNQITEYTVLREKYDADSLQAKLTSLRDDANKTASRQFGLLLCIIILLALGLIVHHVFKRYGDKAGEKRLSRITNDLPALIKERFEVTEGSVHPEDDTCANYFEFAYDWRRDCSHAAKALDVFISKKLATWRENTGADDAKVIFLAHSMGGLVARYYLEVLDGWSNCRALFTMGTPYRGSIKSLNFLANGFKKLFVNLTNPLRSFTSVYQLLPDYRVIQSDGGFLKVNEVNSISGVNMDMVQSAAAFHQKINDNLKANRNLSAYREAGYTTFPIVGTLQPTWQSVALVDETIEPLFDLPTAINQILDDGDGTVPYLSAIPPEIATDYKNSFQAELHGSLPSNDVVLDYIYNQLIFMQSEIELRKVRGPETISREEIRPAISLSVDDAYINGEPIRMSAKLYKRGKEPIGSHEFDQHMRSLLAIIEPIEGEVPVIEQSFRKEGDEWILELENLPSGGYRVEVRTALEGPSAPYPVHDLFAVTAETAN